MAADPTKGYRPETLAVAHGYDPEMGMWAAKPPIYMTSTFVYPSAQYAKDVHEAFFDGTGPLKGTTHHIYSRLGHPGLDFLEKRLAAMDGAEAAAAFASGMAAHSAIALAFMRPGDTMIHGRPIYGGVDMLYNQFLTDFGIGGEAYLDGTDEAEVRRAADAAMARGTLKLIVAETPANPTAAIVDLELMVRLADEIGARQGHRPLVVVDNTFLGPFAQRPIELGVDLNMTSLTKYCAGHSDLLAGGVSGKAELIEKLRFQRVIWGSHLDPFTSWLVLRSMESVAVRMERAMDNARAVAEWLRDHPKVAGVTYLGFLPEGSRPRAVYDRQCKAAGSTFSFHLHGGEAEAFRMLDGLKLLKLAVSLGGSETLICHSASTTHYAVPREQRLAGGITDGTMRLSVGLE
ncbi:MAG TPA: PLP-dependent transferase, partial [Novosphingobium sp.]|nr:PLP-dependent transferase [Novosphingobium sp.]